jgi:hypothetical protein
VGGGGDAPCNYAPIADEYHSLHDASNPNWKFGGPTAPLFAKLPFESRGNLAIRARYGPETRLAVPYDVSLSRNAVRYDQQRFGAVPYPFRRTVRFPAPKQRGGGRFLQLRVQDIDDTVLQMPLMMQTSLA